MGRFTAYDTQIGGWERRVRTIAVRTGGDWRALAPGRRKAFVFVVRGARRPPLRVAYTDGSVRTFS